jgi:MATE family multidrug resistance protein
MAAIALGAGFMALMTLLAAVFRHHIPLVFMGFGTAPTDATLLLAATLLLLGASFFIADGVQTVAAGALRGLNDTRMTLVYAAICFWVVGFSICYALGFPLRYGAPGIWIGLSIGLTLYAPLLIRRFHRLTKRGYLPDVASPT